MRGAEIIRRCTKLRRSTPGFDVIWKVDKGDNRRNITLATISICIKEDMRQSLNELAAKVAKCKNRPIPECIEVLQKLLDKGNLGYYDKLTLEWKSWKPGR